MGIEHLFLQARDLLLSAQRILILSHRSPDGDTLGANLALRNMLKMMGKEVVSACIDPIPEIYHVFPCTRAFVRDFDERTFDLFVNVDASSVAQLVFPEKKPFLLEKTVPMINFDHHVSNTLFGTLNIVVPQACSATYVLQEFFEYCGWKISPLVATYLLLGHYYDTGFFMHSNTTSEVYEAAARLVRMGADRDLVTRGLRSYTINQLRLWGSVLEKIEKTEDGGVVAGAREEDVITFGASPDQVSGVVDFLNTTAGARFSIMLSESREQGIVKGSTRTQRDDVDLAEFCRRFGGGGHKKASGFRVTGHLEYDSFYSFPVPESVQKPRF